MKCICHNIPILTIIQKAKELNLSTLEEVLNNIDCGQKCKLCHNYIETLLAHANP